MAKVEITLLEHEEIPFGSFMPGHVLTDEYGPFPYGHYLAVFGWRKGDFHTNPITPDFITGMGQVWPRMHATTNQDPGGLSQEGTAIYSVVGALARGPLAMDAFTLDDGLTVPIVGGTFRWAIGLFRVRNAPTTNNGLDALVQAFAFGGSNPPGGSFITHTFSNPIGDARNALLGHGAGGNFVAAWPMVQEYNEGGVYHAWTGPGVRSTSWLYAAGPTSIGLIELGFHETPYLRQKQRDDI